MRKFRSSGWQRILSVYDKKLNKGNLKRKCARAYILQNQLLSTPYFYQACLRLVSFNSMWGELRSYLTFFPSPFFFWIFVPLWNDFTKLKPIFDNVGPRWWDAILFRRFLAAMFHLLTVMDSFRKWFYKPRVSTILTQILSWPRFLLFSLPIFLL